MKTEKIDVIIPTYHPGKEFAALLECLEQQSCPVSRIIVMNTEEQFWDIKWEKEHPCLEVHHLKKENFDHGGTRRQAAELSDGDVMVFLTQDAMPADKNTVSHLVKALNSQENIGAAYARQLPNSSCSFVEAYTRSFNYPEPIRQKRIFRIIRENFWKSILILTMRQMWLRPKRLQMP